jgi:Rad51
MAQRSKDLRKLAGILKGLATEWNVAVIAVNQVTDAFKKSSQSADSTQEEELLPLEQQSKWFDGLIDEHGTEGTKKPALGLVWSNLITSRIMLVREVDGRTRIKVVFSPFAKPGSLLYAISTEVGIHAIDTSGVTLGEEKNMKVNVDYHDDAALDDVVQIISSDFDAKIYDVEFSDFDPEGI